MEREREKERIKMEVLFLLLLFCRFTSGSFFTRTFSSPLSSASFSLSLSLLFAREKIELIHGRVCVREKESFHDLVVNIVYKHRRCRDRERRQTDDSFCSCLFLSFSCVSNDV